MIPSANPLESFSLSSSFSLGMMTMRDLGVHIVLSKESSISIFKVVGFPKLARITFAAFININVGTFSLSEASNPSTIILRAEK